MSRMTRIRALEKIRSDRRGADVEPAAGPVVPLVSPPKATVPKAKKKAKSKRKRRR